ncbi:hypothetical protein E5676_scaffold519G00310 [Cucumis melo var. makuwa]|uniref:Uncharacterized protein n=1 Tax=Cucumis melo var. makuwa TaxID=1194695 RepID=A0A5D3DA68_CUCMM|nr:hypothetical protein E6C27_scaffold24G003310 [Cucumis melo var. makuwa]TYK20404.1 hypothetical protein E5676_scaffold519G00310 [Cucumis melo var. makuwa]
MSLHTVQDSSNSLGFLGHKTQQVGGKDIESPPSKGDACPKAPSQKISLTHAPLKFSELPLGTSNRQTMRNPEPSQWVGEKERAVQLSLEKKKLERRFQSINAEYERLSILSCEKAEAIDQQKLEVAKLQDEINTLESTPAITEEAIKALATVRKSMEAA